MVGNTCEVQESLEPLGAALPGLPGFGRRLRQIPSSDGPQPVFKFSPLQMPDGIIGPGFAQADEFFQALGFPTAAERERWFGHTLLVFLLHLWQRHQPFTEGGAI